MNTKSNSTDGVLYVALGEKYIAEAAESAISVRSVSESLGICLITDSEDAPDVFDECIKLPSFNDRLEAHIKDVPALMGYLAKVVGLRLTPYKRTIFLDTDIHAAQPFNELFSLLRRFDLGLAHAPYRGGGQMSSADRGMPFCPSLNTGVIAYRSTLKVWDLFERWENLIISDAPEDKSYFGDQTVIRKAITETGVSVSMLPAEYNLRIGVPSQVDGLVRLLHGRPKTGWKKHVDCVNASDKPRIYFGSIGIVVFEKTHFRLYPFEKDREPRDIGFSEFSKLLFRGEFNL